jgi:hypothetical protein
MPDGAKFHAFERLSEDLATGRHNWREHKLALVLMAKMPADGHCPMEGARPLQHTMTRAGRVTTLAIGDCVVRADDAALPPFACAAVVNATSGTPIGAVDLGRSVTLEMGSSFTFKFPPDLVRIT